jgi:ribose-phosphate pyrophosphokinase
MAQPRMYGNIEIFSGTGSLELANKISDYMHVPLSPREITTFPNENIFVRLLTSVRGQDVFIIQTTSSPVNYNIMELLLLLDTVKRASAGRITAVIPYFAYARSDKKDQPRVPISARLIADLITVAGADRYMLVDLHAGQIQGFFGIPGDELTTFHLLSDYFLSKQLANAVVSAVDLGFAKKGRNFAQKLGFPMAFIEKRRDIRDSSVHALTVIGDVADKNVLLVDDEVNTGHSVAEAVEILKHHGAADIYFSFAHAAFSPDAIERMRALPIREMVCTDTVPISQAVRERLPNLTVLSVASLLGEVIRRVHEGESVGEMFGE